MDKDHSLPMIRSVEYIRHGEDITIFRHESSMAVDEHTHEFIEIVYTLSGQCDHIIDGCRYRLKRGDLLFLSIGQTHSVEPVGNMALVNCLVAPQFIDKELLHGENALELLALSSFADFEGSMDKLVPMVSFRGKELLATEALIEDMFEEFYAKRTNYRTALRGMMLVLLTRIFRQMQSSDTAELLPQVHRLTPELLKYIEENCCEKITLDQLARKCFYNPSYFSRVFKQCYGKSPMEFIHEKRIQEALRLLKHTDWSVEAVSLAVGYRDRKQFYKLFKQYAGMTPSAARALPQAHKE